MLQRLSRGKVGFRTLSPSIYHPCASLTPQPVTGKQFSSGVGNTELGKARRELLLLYRVLAYYGYQEAVDNHCSKLIPNHPITNRRAIITARWGADWRMINDSDLICMDVDSGELIDDPSIDNSSSSTDGITSKYEYEISAAVIHRGIQMTDRNDIDCIIHSHTTNITALSCLEPPHNRILPTHQNCIRFTLPKGVCNMAYEDSDDTDSYDGIFTSDAQMEDIRNRFSDGTDILLMANHGVTVTGNSVAMAFDRLYFLDRVSQLQNLCLSTNKPLRLIDDRVIESTIEYLKPIEYDYAVAHYDSVRKYVESIDKFPL